MVGLIKRLLSARKQKELSQQEQAKMAIVHFTNVGKNERGEAVLSAAILNRTAEEFDVSNHFLLSGTAIQQAENSLQDAEQLMQFQKVEQLSDNKEQLVKEYLDFILLKDNLKKLLM